MIRHAFSDTVDRRFNTDTALDADQHHIQRIREGDLNFFLAFLCVVLDQDRRQEITDDGCPEKHHQFDAVANRLAGGLQQQK